MADLEAEKPYAIAVEEPKADPADGKSAAGEFTAGKWEVGFCDCFKHCVPNCLMTSCCPCVTLAQISSRLGMMPFKFALLLSILLLIFPCVGSLIFALWIWRARKEVRERFQIPGGCCGDCLASCCCGCCAMAQMATHIKSYKPGNCAFGPQDTLAPYQRA
ncbi:PLAC8 family [Phytophthora infestans]|uniref:PLAC8 family n=1 Tax=Phytophthora infestans TaxID=4787 RepID=A0A833WK73_PHYIN|nr:PLAC8 family [Phytophthora infestans]KAF4149006.1 PLAC8 family [Phytophthora infestans]